MANTPNQNKSPRILIAAGGTGGHVYPAIAIADALQKLDGSVELLFVGTRRRMEWKAVPKAGYKIADVWISGFHRRLTIKNLLFPVKLLISLIQSMKIIKQFKPDAVIACGGYVSGPVGWVAAKMKVPLFLQEQNSYPGVTNRLLSNSAKTIFTAFKDAEKTLPGGKVKNIGNPVRSSLHMGNRAEALKTFEFHDSKPVLLILGGSGGALSINKAMARHIEFLHDELDLQIIWQCGHKYYDKFSSGLDLKSLQQLRLKSYINSMAEAYCAANLVISRAGALSCTELQITGNASILVPSPHVAANHQTMNAQSMVKEGAAYLLPDHEIGEKLGETVEHLIKNREKIDYMAHMARKMGRPDADKQIARHLLSYIKNNN